MISKTLPLKPESSSSSLVSSLALYPASDARLLVILNDQKTQDVDGPFSVEELGLGWLQSLVVKLPSLSDDSSLNQGVDAIFALLEKLHEQGWDSRQIFLFGVGGQGTVVLEAALRSILPLGGVISSSSYIHLSEDWTRVVTAGSFATPRLIIHGCFDGKNPIVQVRAAVSKLQSIGLPVVFKELNKSDEFELSQELALLIHWFHARTSSRRSSHETSLRMA